MTVLNIMCTLYTKAISYCNSRIKSNDLRDETSDFIFAKMTNKLKIMLEPLQLPKQMNIIALLRKVARVPQSCVDGIPRC